MKFFLLELLKYFFDEKRLVFGEKLEIFLLNQLKKSQELFLKVISSSKFPLFSGVFVVFFSILLRSSRDIGYQSGIYLDIATKILANEKYYQDFFTHNFPFAFYITLIPVFLANFFQASSIIFLEIFVNLIGIFSLCFSFKILKKSDLKKENQILNLIIFGYAIGFFLRVLTLQFNEFGTSSTYLLALIFPYISYQFLPNSQLQKIDQFILGIISILMILLNPLYVIFLLIFEIRRFFESKYFQKLFFIKNLIIFVIFVFYISFLSKNFPNFDVFLSIKSDFLSNFKLILKEDIFPAIVIFLFGFSFIKKDKILQILAISSLSSILILALESSFIENKRFIFYSISLPFLLLFLREIIIKKTIDFKKDGLILIGIIFILQFDHNIFVDFIFNLVFFWWILAIFLARSWKKNLPKDFSFNNSFLQKLFFQVDLKSKIYFVLLVILSIKLSLENSLLYLAWFIVAIIFVFLLKAQQNLFVKLFDSRKFSRFSICVIFIVFSYILSLHKEAIIGFSELKSPNYIGEEIAKTIKNSEEFLIISKKISDNFPLINYLKLKNNLNSLNANLLYDKINGVKIDNKEYEELFENLKSQLNSKNNKLVFIESQNRHFVGFCNIGLLEYYLRDLEFREIFFKNYRFLNRIVERKLIKKEVKISSEFSSNESKLKYFVDSISENDEIIRDFEVYIRKDAKVNVLEQL